MEIKVLGTGCAGCKALYQTVEQTVKELGLTAEIIKKKICEDNGYNVRQLPALVVDGKVVSKRKSISTRNKSNTNQIKDITMKRFLFFSLICLFSVLGMAQSQTDKYVEVLYFHGKQRCVTCKAIEKYTREVVYTDFAELVKSGKVRFKEVDISTSEGEKLANKYRVSWSSLYVNGWKNGKEERNDMTQFSFQNARNKTDLFKKEVKKKINQLLK